MEQAPLLNNREAAKFLNLSPRTLEKWRWSGGGPCFKKVGRRTMYSPEDLETYLAERTRRSTSDPGPEAR